MNRTAQLAKFAARTGIPPEDAYVLPAVFERCAQIAGLTTDELVARGLNSPALGRYLAEVARKVARKERAAAGSAQSRSYG